MNCISEQDLDELNIELIRNTLYKVCLVAINCFILTLSLLCWPKLPLCYFTLFNARLYSITVSGPEITIGQFLNKLQFV